MKIVLAGFAVAIAFVMLYEMTFGSRNLETAIFRGIIVAVIYGFVVAIKRMTGL